MQRRMLALDGFLRRRRWAVLVLWAAVLAAAIPFAVKQGDHLTGGGFSTPGSQSQAVEDALARDFPGAQRANLAAVVVAREGATAGDVDAAVARVRRAAEAAPRIAPGGEAREGRGVVLVPLAADVPETEASDLAVDLRERLGIGTEAMAQRPATIHLVGQGALWAGMQDLSKEDLEQAEVTGFPLVLLILLAVFGSLAAALLPLALGLASVLVTGALIFLLSRSLDMSVFTTNMASMIGIGVAVDYSLFVLARFREEVRAGRPPEAARATALATSGLAVAFSGMTVIVALAGLFMIDTTAIRSMALGAILVVAISVLASATLLPLLIGLLGRRAYARGRAFTIAGLVARSRARRRRGSTRPDRDRRGFWERWTATVMRRPVVSFAAAAALLLALAYPALGLTTRDGALEQFPAGHEVREGVEAAATLGGAGDATPVKVLARLRKGTVEEPANRAALGDLRAALRADPQVRTVAEPMPGRDRRSVLVLATPAAHGESDAAKALVRRLREQLPRSPVAEAAALSVGGATAGQVDFGEVVSGSMFEILLFVLALSYLVLLVLLRSAVLPLKAALMNLLSVGAAFGVLTLVFGEVDTITPPLVLAVVFGLSMDYEVFLLSRIRERFAATGDSRRAVAEGLAGSARTITSAALIMVCVFAVFVFTGVPSIQQLGLGCAVAIALDATIVRLVLVPAAMALLGRWNWWLPRPLARVLPRTSIESLEPVPARA